MSNDGLLSRWRSWAPRLLSILRIVAAFVFFQVGSAKWFAFPAAVMPGGGTAPPGSLVWFAAVLEVVGGSLLFLGLFTFLYLSAAGPGPWSLDAKRGASA